MHKLREPEVMLTFIEKYKEQRNLWELKHPAYHKSDVRRATICKLAEDMKPWIPDADYTMINNKINNLRNSYKKKYKEVRQSKRSGAAADDVVKPKLWYYRHLQFLDDQIEARESISSLPSTLPSTLPSSVPSTLPSTPAEAEEEPPELEEPDLRIFSQDEASQEEEGQECGRQEEAGPSGTQQVPRPSGSTVSQVAPLHVRPPKQRRMTQVEEESLKMIQEAAAIMRAPLNPTEGFSTYLADKLLRMEAGQRALCEHLIYMAVHMGARGLLTEATHISQQANPSPPSPPPPATSPPTVAQPARVRGRGRGENAAERRGRKATGKSRR